MKRGLITWDKTEIAPEVFQRRVDEVRRVAEERGVPALAVYSDLWRSNTARYFSNFMPYFNRALLIIPVKLPATLFCGLSPRVYGWIRSVTTIEDVRAAGNFAKPLFELASERSWTRIGALDFDQFPYDIHKALRGGSLEVVNVESGAVFIPAGDRNEMEIRRKAAALVRQVLAEEMPQAVGTVDHHFVGRLERRFRRAGAEDLVTLLTNGHSVPGPPAGAVLEAGFSVSIAMEYRGHWVRITRADGGPDVLDESRKSVVPENLAGSYPWECRGGTIPALHIEIERNGKRLFWGDTIL